MRNETPADLVAGTYPSFNKLVNFDSTVPPFLMNATIWPEGGPSGSWRVRSQFVG